MLEKDSIYPMLAVIVKMSRKKKFVKKSDLSMEDITAMARLIYDAILEEYGYTTEKQQYIEEHKKRINSSGNNDEM